VQGSLVIVVFMPLHCIKKDALSSGYSVIARITAIPALVIGTQVTIWISAQLPSTLPSWYCLASRLRAFHAPTPVL